MQKAIFWCNHKLIPTRDRGKKIPFDCRAIFNYRESFSPASLCACVRRSSNWLPRNLWCRLLSEATQRRQNDLMRFFYEGLRENIGKQIWMSTLIYSLRAESFKTIWVGKCLLSNLWWALARLPKLYAELRAISGLDALLWTFFIKRKLNHSWSLSCSNFVSLRIIR